MKSGDVSSDPVACLSRAADEARFGGKAASLSRGLRRGWPVPAGIAVCADAVGRLARGDEGVRAALARAQREAGLADAPVAVRSSAIGEDSATASFAGMHLTVLEVRGIDAVVDALVRVWRSGRTEAAIAYRRELGVEGPPRVAVVIQRMVRPRVAGVLFTRDPVSGADERVVEATHGLGEAVVAGLVAPDRYVWRRGGSGLRVTPGEKDVAIEPCPHGGTREVEVPAERVHAPCLDEHDVARLERLACLVESVEAGPHDLEWALDDELHLLQRRAVTR